MTAKDTAQDKNIDNRKLNGPTVLTIVRIFLVIPVLIGLFINAFPAKIVAIICFVIASITDYIDGAWARREKLVTNLGKFLDPLADKLLVNLTFLCLVALDVVPVWIFGIILARDFIVDGIRMLAASKHVTIAASKIGKLKTLVQMVTLTLILINLITQDDIFGIVNLILLYIVIILTILSGLDYALRGRKLIL